MKKFFVCLAVFTALIFVISCGGGSKIGDKTDPTTEPTEEPTEEPTTEPTTDPPECSSSSGTPCKDSSSGLTWSARASSTMAWDDAKSYCESYTEGGLSGWHLPTIDELKTLLIADRVTSNCQVSETNGCLSSSCWSCSTCTQTGTQSSSGTSCDSWGTSYSDGRYSKFGETGYFWSSSILSDDSSLAWRVYFGYGNVYYSRLGDGRHHVRCVR